MRVWFRKMQSHPLYVNTPLHTYMQTYRAYRREYRDYVYRLCANGAAKYVHLRRLQTSIQIVKFS